MRMSALLLVVCMVTIVTAQDNDDPEHPRIDAASPGFIESTRSSIERLTAAGFEGELQTPTLGANADEIFQTQLQRIKTAIPLSAAVDKTQQGLVYDVVLQPGHYGRPPGKLGTQGKLVSERALVAYVTDVVARRLRDDGLSVLIVSADKYPRPLSAAKVFLAIHAEGSVKQCHAKASLAYNSTSSLLAMHAVGWALSSALGYRYSDFARDNYTPAERDYYMFRAAKADRLMGMLELGELTCEEREKQLISSSELIGVNIASALKYVVRMRVATK
jgi:hypothetical protein